MTTSSADAGASLMAPPLALTMGDPAGIGIDITLAAWAARRQDPLPPFVLFADPDLVASRAHRLGLSVEISVMTAPSPERRDPDDERLPVIPVPLAATAEPGQPDPANAAGVITAIERAVAETMRRIREANVQPLQPPPFPRPSPSASPGDIAAGALP